MTPKSNRTNNIVISSKSKIFLSILFLATLTACGSNESAEAKEDTDSPVVNDVKAEETKTVDYYYENNEVRKERLKECESVYVQTNNVSADCANVTEATNKRTQAFNSSQNTERRESVRAFPDAESSDSYTSDYLYENDELRTKVLEDCKENNQSQDNCSNAHSAETKKFTETSEDNHVQQW